MFSKSVRFSRTLGKTEIDCTLTEYKVYNRPPLKISNSDPTTPRGIYKGFLYKCSPHHSGFRESSGRQKWLNTDWKLLSLSVRSIQSATSEDIHTVIRRHLEVYIYTITRVFVQQQKILRNTYIYIFWRVWLFQYDVLPVERYVTPQSLRRRVVVV